jgi:short-subunit dehydrogenase
MSKGYALVTGSSSGIGTEMARNLAERGYPLLLISNDEAGLERVKTEFIADAFSVRTLTMDLARPESGSELFEWCKMEQLDIEILVNNAGFLLFGQVADTDDQKAIKLINLHIHTVTQLCIFFGKDMREKGRGYILNTSSISAYKDFPGIAFYGASKAFIKSFTRALRHELKPYGIHVTCLSPGATATNLYDDKGINVELGKKLGVMLSARKVGRAGVRALFCNQANVVPGFTTKVMLFLTRLTPHWVIYLIRKNTKLLD